MPFKDIEKRREDVLNRYYAKYKGSAHRKRGYKYILKKKYGLSLEDFHTLYADQLGLCGTCGVGLENIFEEVFGARLTVDHCHTDGHVRGLLCSPCNTGIGLLRDDPDILGKAKEYLEADRSV